MSHPNLIPSHVASVLNTPNLPSRKAAIEILTFICYWKNGARHDLVIAGLETLSAANDTSGPYTFWFKSLEAALSGRGKMGSLVGASEDIRKNAGVDSNLNDYAVE